MGTLATVQQQAQLGVGASDQFFMPDGAVLIATADSNGAANIVRRGVDRMPLEAWTIGADESVTVGPYAHPASIQVDTLTSSVSITVGFPETSQLPAGGVDGAYLRKASGNAFDVVWDDFALVQYTAEERAALDPQPVAGTLIYNSSTGKLNLMGASGWEEVTSVAEGA